MTFWEFQTDTPSINAFKASIKGFEATHPGITVEMSIVGWSEQAQKLTTGLATGGLPDVSMLGNDIVAEFVAEHELLPLVFQPIRPTPSPATSSIITWTASGTQCR